MYNTVFYILIAILVFDFLFERILDYINAKKANSDIPDELAGIYDETEYKKQQAYKQANDKFSMISSSFSFILIILMFFLYGFAFVDNMAQSLSDHYILQPLIFFGILAFVSDILTTPFSYYATFVIEERFGFNRTDLKTFFLDKLKGWLLMIIIGGGILSLIIWFYHKTGENFWIYTWLMISGFSVFMSMFYSNLIVPLFNKQTPLGEGELRTKIEEFSQSANFHLKDIYVIDGSKRSTKANAYFTGLGPKKRIVLYDTLINDLNNDEIVAVLAHEIGHYKKKHTLQGLAISIIETGFTLYILSLLIGNPKLAEALGVTEPTFHISLIAFGILYSPISFILGIFMNILSRKNEYEADRFAVVNFSSDHLINALKKISAKSLSNLTPHPFYVFFHYSHPPLLQRVRAMNEVKNG